MIALIVNPQAGRGRSRDRADAVERALQRVGPVRPYATRSAGDEARCAVEACEAGADVVVVVGGDGSVHHTVRGLLAHSAHTGRRVPLAIFAAGTGNDFVKSLGTPAHEVERMAACVAAGVRRSVDVGRIDDVPFVNAAGLGFDVEVLDRLPRVQWVSGTAAYVITALRALFGYAGYRARVEGTGPNGTDWHTQHLLTVFANGHTFGGTFRIAPHARVDDGQLAMVDIGAIAPWRRPAVFLAAIGGAHLSHAAVRHAVGASWQLTSERPLPFEADGERYTARSGVLRVTIEPQALDVIVQP